MLSVLVLAACGPSDDERWRLRAQEAAGAINAQYWQAKIDSALAEAPSPDSMRAILRGPFMDSMSAATRSRDEALRELNRR